MRTHQMCWQPRMSDIVGIDLCQKSLAQAVGANTQLLLYTDTAELQCEEKESKGRTKTLHAQIHARDAAGEIHSRDATGDICV